MAITTRDLEWTAGFLEGEGSFRFSSRTATVSAAQKTDWPLRRLQRLFGGYITQHGGPDPEVLTWGLSGTAGAGLMMTLYPLLSPRRRAQIDFALEEWRRARVSTRYRTTCPNGHPYDAVTKNGRRFCRQCTRRYQRVYMRTWKKKTRGLDVS